MEAQLSQIPAALHAVIVNAFPLTTIALSSTIRAIVPAARLHSVQTPEEAEQYLSGHDATLVILDIDAPGTYGMSFLRTLRQVAPHARTIVMSGTHEPRAVAAARELGAAGYISKLASMEAIGNTLRKVLTRASPFVRDTIVGLGQYERRVPIAPSASRAVLVTPKQAEVLALLCRGLPNKLIGRQLAIQPSTVKAHVSALLRVYQARNRAELVARAYRDAGSN